MAMMVVTAGVVLLTASFAVLTMDRGQDDQGTERKCEEVMGKMLNDPTLMISDRLMDDRSLYRLDHGSMMSNWTGGGKVMLTFPDGNCTVLYDSSGEVGQERACRSEPVNIYHNQGEIRAALLTVWVWP